MMFFTFFHWLQLLVSQFAGHSANGASALNQN